MGKLPKNVEDRIQALSDRRLDVWQDMAERWDAGSTAPINADAFLSLIVEVKRQRAELHRLTDRLEAADALLLDIKEWDVAEASRRFSLSDNGVIFILPDVLRSRIQSHLQGAGDEA